MSHVAHDADARQDFWRSPSVPEPAAVTVPVASTGMADACDDCGTEFMIGVGCVAGAIGVSLVYRASNLAEFQAIQMWRIEWLLAATAAFVAGILLKKSNDAD